jgi:hypothetical protein
MSTVSARAVGAEPLQVDVTDPASVTAAVCWVGVWFLQRPAEPRSALRGTI